MTRGSRGVGAGFRTASDGAVTGTIEGAVGLVWAGAGVCKRPAVRRVDSAAVAMASQERGMPVWAASSQRPDATESEAHAFKTKSRVFRLERLPQRRRTLVTVIASASMSPKTGEVTKKRFFTLRPASIWATAGTPGKSSRQIQARTLRIAAGARTFGWR